MNEYRIVEVTQGDKVGFEIQVLNRYFWFFKSWRYFMDALSLSCARESTKIIRQNEMPKTRKVME